MKTFTADINGTQVEISSYSKYTLQATIGDKIVATAPSRPKILAKLELMFPKKVEKPAKKISMRKLTLELMLAGDDDQTVLAKVTEQVSGKKYDMRHVKWYRSTFASAEEIPAEFAPKQGKIYKAWLASQAA